MPKCQNAKQNGYLLSQALGTLVRRWVLQHCPWLAFWQVGMLGGWLCGIAKMPKCQTKSFLLSQALGTLVRRWVLHVLGWHFGRLACWAAGRAVLPKCQNAKQFLFYILGARHGACGGGYYNTILGWHFGRLACWHLAVRYCQNSKMPNKKYFAYWALRTLVRRCSPGLAFCLVSLPKRQHPNKQRRFEGANFFFLYTLANIMAHRRRFLGNA